MTQHLWKWGVLGAQLNPLHSKGICQLPHTTAVPLIRAVRVSRLSTKAPVCALDMCQRQRAIRLLCPSQGFFKALLWDILAFSTTAHGRVTRRKTNAPTDFSYLNLISLLRSVYSRLKRKGNFTAHKCESWKYAHVLEFERRNAPGRRMQQKKYPGFLDNGGKRIELSFLQKICPLFRYPLPHNGRNKSSS